MEFKYCKLEIFIPETKILELQKALQKVDAGHIGNYDSCMSVSQVTGYWRPLDGKSPADSEMLLTGDFFYNGFSKFAFLQIIHQNKRILVSNHRFFPYHIQIKKFFHFI